MPDLNEQGIEAAARAMRPSSFATFEGEWLRWTENAERKRSEARQDARAAITAYLKVTEKKQ